MEVALKTDSRAVKPGDTFIAIPNVARDGHDYIEQAIANGATKIIAEHGSYKVETIIVESTREYLKTYLYENYYPLIKDIKLIGLTGTNGKTTTCLMTYQILKMLKKNVAYMGTIGGRLKPSNITIGTPAAESCAQPSSGIASINAYSTQ